eukprot:6009757-Amphidinium_carterae.1
MGACVVNAFTPPAFFCCPTRCFHGRRELAPGLPVGDYPWGTTRPVLARHVIGKLYLRLGEATNLGPRSQDRPGVETPTEPRALK